MLINLFALVLMMGSKQLKTATIDDLLGFVEKAV